MAELSYASASAEVRNVVEESRSRDTSQFPAYQAHGGLTADS